MLGVQYLMRSCINQVQLLPCAAMSKKKYPLANRPKPEMQPGLDSKIWDMACRDTPRHAIRDELGLGSINEVDERILAYQKEIKGDSYRAHFQRESDLEKFAMIVHAQIDIATKTSIPVVKIGKNGEPYVIQDYDTPRNSAQLVSDIIMKRAKILGYEIAPDQSQNPRDNIMVWLNQAPKEKQVNAPMEIEDIEFTCDAEN